MIRCHRQTVKAFNGNVKDVNDQVKPLFDY